MWLHSECVEHSVAMGTDPTPSTTSAAVVVEPRYSKVMPWVLIGAGFVLACAAFAVRDHVRHDSTVVVLSRLPQTQTTIPTAPTTSAGKRASPTARAPTKSTT